MKTQTKQLSLLETKQISGGTVNFEEPLSFSYDPRDNLYGILPRHMQIALDNATDGRIFDLTN